MLIIITILLFVIVFLLVQTVRGLYLINENSITHDMRRRDDESSVVLLLRGNNVRLDVIEEELKKISGNSRWR